MILTVWGKPAFGYIKGAVDVDPYELFSLNLPASFLPPPTQARGLGIPMDERVLEEHWNQLVGSCFAELERTTKELVTTDDVVDEALLEELRWALSRNGFEDLVQSEIDLYVPCSEHLLVKLLQ